MDPIGGGSPTTLASGQSSPRGIAVDAKSVYWANEGTGALMKVPIGGGDPSTVASGQDLYGTRIVLDATSVYWLSNGAIMKAPIGGGNPTSISSVTQANIFDFAVDASSVYSTYLR